MVSLMAAAFLPTAAGAQQITDFLGSDIPFDLPRGEGVSVQDRQHPELEAVGFHAGSMVLFPTIATGIGYTTNVYGANTGAVADGFVTVKPQLAVVSQWSRNFLEFTGSAEIKRFFTQTARSENAYSLQTDGRLDLGAGGSAIIGIIHHERAFEEQYSGSFPKNAADPIAIDRTDATIRGTFEFNRLRLLASEKIVGLSYSNTYTLAHQLLDEQYQNRTEYHSAVRLEYAFTPDIATFAEASYIRSNYHVATAVQPLRSNNGVRFLVGGNFDLGKLLRGTIGVGYEDHQYDLGFYTPIKGIAFDARLQWLPTELTTVNFNATRKVEDAINANSPGYFATIARLRIDHELLRYVLLFADATYEHDGYVAIARRDDQYIARGGFSYSLGRHFKLEPSLWYIVRESAGAAAGPAFKEQRGTIELSTQW